MEDYQGGGGRNTEGNLRRFTVVVCCESAHLQSVPLCMFLSSESGKTYLFKFCTDSFLVKPVCLI